MPESPLPSPTLFAGLGDLVARCRGLPLPGLVEALRADQARRWRAGQGLPAEAYLDAFPDLAASAEDALVLVWGEVLLRCERGAPPLPDEYRARFPRHAEALAVQFELQRHLDATVPAAAADAAGPPRVPGYEVLGEVGRGGMGVVYKARQVRLNRVVALKLVRDAGRAGPEQLARFLQEAEVIARFQHPNIIGVHEVGTHAGCSYLALEFVDGPNLAQKCGGTPQPAREAARLVELLAAAAHEAHQRGVVHRDLKPANVLLTAAGMPKIADFGLAKLAEMDSGLTQTGAILGTPSYMAPEQARGGKAQPVGPAVDVYALGAILYELLTGRPPFQGETAMDTLHRVVNEEPAAVRSLRPDVPRDLATVCHKCLQKDPARRYGSAAGLAEDLRRFQAGRPVAARPVGAPERAWRWARRNPALAALTAAAATLLVAAAVSGTVAAVQARLLAQQEAREKEEKDARLYLHSIALAHRELSADNLARAEDLLEGCPADRRRWEWYYLKRLCRVEPTVLRGSEEGINGAAFSPDGRRLAAADGDGTVGLFDVATGQRLQVLRGHRGRVFAVAFDPAGRRLASASADQTVKLWDLATSQAIQTHDGSAGVFLGGATSLAFSPDGLRLAASQEQRLMVWDMAGGHLGFSGPGHKGLVTSVAFSPDGRLLASGCFGGRVRLWDADTGHLLRELQAHEFPVATLAFHPDGRRLATGSYDRLIKLWDVATGAQLGTLRGHMGLVVGLAFCPPDGRRLASCGEDKTVKLWDTDSGQELLNLRGHTLFGSCVCFSPDGRRLASASKDGTVRLWDATPLTGGEGLEALTLRHDNEVWSVAFSPDGRLIASAGWDKTVRLWDAAGGMPVHRLTTAGDVFRLSFNPADGKYLATSAAVIGRTGVAVQVWDVAAGREVLSFRDAFPPFSVTFSPDGRHLLRGGPGHAIRVWDARTAREVGMVGRHDQDIWCLTFSPDGRRLASGSMDWTVKLWDATRLGQEQKPLAVIPVRGGGVGGDRVTFTPDGRHLVTVGEEHLVKVWDASTGQVVRTLAGHTGAVCAVAVSPDGRRIASAGEDTTVRLWDAVTGKLLHTLRGHVGLVGSVAFSPDGRRLVSGSRDHTVKVWDLARLGKRGP